MLDALLAWLMDWFVFVRQTADEEVQARELSEVVHVRLHGHRDVGETFTFALVVSHIHRCGVDVEHVTEHFVPRRPVTTLSRLRLRTVADQIRQYLEPGLLSRARQHVDELSVCEGAGHMSERPEEVMLSDHWQVTMACETQTLSEKKAVKRARVQRVVKVWSVVRQQLRRFNIIDKHVSSISHLRMNGFKYMLS